MEISPADRTISRIWGTWQRSMTRDSWIFCHRCALKIWMRDIFSVGILPCMKIPVRSSCTCMCTLTGDKAQHTQTH